MEGFNLKWVGVGQLAAGVTKVVRTYWAGGGIMLIQAISLHGCLNVMLSTKHKYKWLS